ncbi:MAG: hypothetical protein KatS3mg057_0225 [Herpetosiphonaceae bacterium]|nr:MAG: hypothetical protein KatS3mg057_0225 [Herpetosiphonaceae bacterium]
MNSLALAARQPLAVTVLAAAIISGLVVALWLLPLGLVVYLAMVLLASRDPQLQALAARPTRPRNLAPAFKHAVDHIERTSGEIERLIASTSGSLRRLLDPIGEQARTLVAHAYGLAEKGAVIDQYCASAQPQQIRQQIAAIDARLAATSDEYTRQQLQSTRAALVEQEQNVTALMTYRERVIAQLTNVAANLDKVYTDTLRLRAAQVTDATSISGQIAEQLNNLNADVDAFQHVLEGALGQAGAS